MRDGALHYQETVRNIPLPAGAEALGVRTREPYRTRGALLDFTGDGLPDLVYPEDPAAADSSLMLARNLGGSAFAAPTDEFFNGPTTGLPLGLTTTPDPPPSLDFLPPWLQQWYLDRYPPEPPRTETWVQVLDMNGDGRLDIVDARDSADAWTVYLNHPGVDDDSPEWLEQTVSIAPCART